ncbi:unnamed protein product [Adineta ricciae]|uniref:Uncharacterized protein n=1 Tax=Adineta ricciae TaxID=249248 RepID=A0A814PQ48_ADIRI|nr:unnamed protein product [Adineta ricciae]
MVFDTSSPPTSSSSTDRVVSLHRMYDSAHSSSIELQLSDERDLSQIEAAARQQHQPSKWKMMSKRRQSCANDMYATASRYHRLKPLPTINQLTPSEELLPSSSSYFTTYDKFSNNQFSHDNMKYFSHQSALITTRRSTTDCNDLNNFNRRPLEPKNNTLLTIVDEESRDSLWPSADDHHLLLPTSRSSHTANSSAASLAMFYSDPSMTPCSSISSFNSHSNSTDLRTSSSSSSSSQYSSSLTFYHNMPETPKTLSSSSSLSLSSGYESNVPTSASSLNSVSDQLFLSSPDSIMMPPPPVPSPKLPLNSDHNLVEQFIDLHLQKQTSFDQEVAYSPPSSFSSSSSSFLSQAPISALTSPVRCRKCDNHDDKNQLSSDTEDDSQSTTITPNLVPSQQQQKQHQNKRPRSLPIAIQQPKGVSVDPTALTNDDEDEDDDDSDSSLQNSLSCHCPVISSRKKRFRTCEFNHQPILNAATSANGLFSDNTLMSTATDKLHIALNDPDEQKSNDQTPIKQQKNSLEHFIMSPTDKVKVQMKYPPLNNNKESDTISNELKISQPEDIDFKRSKQKAIRVLYQNRLNLNSIQSPVPRQNLNKFPSRTAANHCDSPLANRTVNPRIIRR